MSAVYFLIVTKCTDCMNGNVSTVHIILENNLVNQLPVSTYST